MKNKKHFRMISIGVVFAIFLIGLAACTSGPPTDSTLPAEIVSETAAVQETQTPQVPTATAGLPTVVLASDPGVDPFIVSELQAAIEPLAAETGLVLVTETGLDAGMISSNVQVVVGVGPDMNIEGLAAGAPQISFVAVHNPGVTPADNLSVIGDPEEDIRRQAFMAGYLAALISFDYKVAALIPSDIEDSNLYVNSFVIGARFFCGICQPKFPPYNAFPQWETLPTANATSGFQTVVDSFVSNGVEILYVQELLATPELLTYLEDQGLKVIGDSHPDRVRSNWVGTLISDPAPALVELWSDLLTVSSGVQVPASITLTDTGEGLISDGRQRLFEEMVEDLESGLISTGSNP